MHAISMLFAYPYVVLLSFQVMMCNFFSVALMLNTLSLFSIPVVRSNQDRDSWNKNPTNYLSSGILQDSWMQQQASSASKEERLVCSDLCSYNSTNHYYVLIFPVLQRFVLLSHIPDIQVQNLARQW